VLVGTEDIVVPPENAEVLASVWPQCEVERLEGGGHAFFALEPQRVAARITTFAKRADNAPARDGRRPQ
jgi:pimeloyl-ACP methyl ester carboxylesterase